MSRGSKLRWLWRAPARALGRARDMYVRGVTGCARYVPADAAFGYPVIVPASLASTRYRGGCGWTDDYGPEEDLRQLVRAASQREMMMRASVAVTRSRSAMSSSMARIDEDAPCEFGGVGAGDDGVGGALHARSRSCVVGGGGGEAVRRRTARGGHRKVVALGS